MDPLLAPNDLFTTFAFARLLLLLCSCGKNIQLTLQQEKKPPQMLLALD